MNENEMATCPVCEKRFDHTNDIGEHTYCLRCLVEKHGWDRPRVDNDDEPAVINKSWRSGNLPPDDPDQWENIYHFDTAWLCWECGGGIGMILGPIEILEPYVMEYLPQPLSEGWTEGYDQPVCIYSVKCPQPQIEEWEHITKPSVPSIDIDDRARREETCRHE